MRVQNKVTTNLESMRKEKKGTGQIQSFSSALIQAKEKMNDETIQRLLQMIDSQGEILAKYQTFENLLSYKKLVKQCIEEAVRHGIHLQEKHSFQPHRGTKIYRLIEVIEQKLIDLTEQILDQEAEGIGTLAMVGEIKGLLINLYQ